MTMFYSILFRLQTFLVLEENSDDSWINSCENIMYSIQCIFYGKYLFCYFSCSLMLICIINILLLFLNGDIFFGNSKNFFIDNSYFVIEVLKFNP